MGLRIHTNVASLSTQRHLSNSTHELAGSMRRLASGQRIAVAADDAAGLGISERMRAQLVSIRSAERNLQDGISLTRVGEGALQEMTSAINRARELALQAANGSLSDRDRAVLEAELGSLAEEVQRIVDGTEFNGLVLFQTDRTVSIQIGSGTGNDGVLDIELRDVTRPAEVLRDASVIDIESARRALADIDSALEEVSEARGRFGSQETRMESTFDSLAQSRLHLTATESRIRDVDLAEETAELVRLQMKQGTGIAMLMRATRGSELALLLMP